VQAPRPIAPHLFSTSGDETLLRAAACDACTRLHFPAGDACPYSCAVKLAWCSAQSTEIGVADRWDALHEVTGEDPSVVVWWIGDRHEPTVAEAHARGCVLRDFTPGNVMVRPDGELRLIDLELAVLKDDIMLPTKVGTPGFSAPEIHKKLSLRASVTSELVLDEVRVPAENLLPGATSLRGPLSCLNEARFGIVFGAVGAARACFEAALSYAKTRIVFEKPNSAYQLTQLAAPILRA